MPFATRTTKVVRTNERFGVELVWQNYGDLVEAVEAEGWTQAGEGNFATVLVRGNEAIKVFADEAYTQYLVEVVRPDCPAFPRLLSPIYRGQELSLVHLERLEPVGDHIAEYFIDVRESMRCSFENGSISGDIDLERLKSFLGDHALDALAGIFRLGETRDYIFDAFYASNVMMREGYDGVVFTDPLAAYEEE